MPKYTFENFVERCDEVQELFELMDAIDEEIFDNYDEEDRAALVQQIIMIRNMLKSIEASYFSDE